MEMRELVNIYGIIGVISNYDVSIDLNKSVSELGIDNLESSLKLVELDDNIINKKLYTLPMSVVIKLDLLTKINKDLIIIGGLSNYLNHKDLEFIKKLLIKLNKENNKKIIVIDSDLKVFFDLVKRIVVIENNKIIYDTDNYYDDLLINYARIPKIIEFVKYVNKDKKVLKENTDIYELIKDIYRSVS